MGKYYIDLNNGVSARFVCEERSGKVNSIISNKYIGYAGGENLKSVKKIKFYLILCGALADF